jgi:MSHA biogenesis protein MshO
VITTPVTYACDTAAGTLTRWRGYAIQLAQPAALPGGGVSDLLANNVSNCSFAYDPLVSARNGLVSMNLAITRDGETVTLYSATHVSNMP